MTDNRRYLSWGRVIRTTHQVSRPLTRDAAAQCVADGGGPVLGCGCGRSYGDVGLNQGGRLIDCRGLDRFIAFDRTTGILTCEAGVTLAEILVVVCRPDADGSGWLLPVTPGTRFVTVGGAIANDVHGKNHHAFGTFGSHVLSFELARTDGSRVTCSQDEHPGLFAATIGGLGLTGLILSATIQMRRVPGLAVEAEDIRFDGLADFFALADELDQAWQYTAAWIDCMAGGRSLGRGIYRVPVTPLAGVPTRPRCGLGSGCRWCRRSHWSARSRCARSTPRDWRKLGFRRRSSQIGGYEKVFYPLDAIGEWNRVYGPGGLINSSAEYLPGPCGGGG